MVQNLNETPEDVRETEAFIKRNRKFIDYGQVTIATPYPGSVLYRRAKRQGWILEEHGPDNTYNPVMSTPWMSADEAREARKRLARLLKPRGWRIKNLVKRAIGGTP